MTRAPGGRKLVSDALIGGLSEHGPPFFFLGAARADSGAFDGAELPRVRRVL